jgi:heme/copper-type cytochrome/quinol oxidase subunit 2
MNEPLQLHIYELKNEYNLYNKYKMSIALIAIPLLLIAILYIVFFRAKKANKAKPVPQSRPAEVVRASLEERVRRRMGK